MRDVRTREIDNLAKTVHGYLLELAQRHGRDKKIRDLRAAVMLSIRLAYSLGRSHAIEEQMEEAAAGELGIKENGHEK